MKDVKIVRIAEVEQEFEAVSAVAALNDAGIDASYKEFSDGGRLGLPGAMGIPDGFGIYVDEQDKERAEDVLMGIGCAADNSAADNSASEDSETDTGKAEKGENPQTLADLMPENPVLSAVYKVILGLLLLILIGVFVWLCDTAINWVMGLFR